MFLDQSMSLATAVNGSSARVREPQAGLPLHYPEAFWDLSGDLFSVHDSEGRFVDVNPAWQRVLGWERDCVLGRPTTDFLHPDDLESAGAAAAAAVDGDGRVGGAESRYLCADGSYRWVLWSAYTDGDGWFGVGKDITERKEAEVARDLAERRVAEAYDTAGLSRWRWDPASDSIVFAGEREETRVALGLPRTLEGTLQLVRPSHREYVRRALTRAAEGVDEGFCIRYPSTIVDGRARWVEARGVVVRDEEGGVRAMQGTTQDVTEAELARLELLRNRNFNQATLDSLAAHVAVLDEGGTIVFVNGAWTRFASHNEGTGLGVGDNYLAVCDAAGHDAPEAAPVAQALRRMLGGSLSRYEVEYPCHSPDEERWFHLRAVLHRADGPTRLVLQHDNVTERVQAERAARLRSRLLDEVDAAVIATDFDGWVTSWNRGAEVLYGWSGEEALGREISRLIVPASDGVGLPTGDEMREQIAWEHDLEVQRKDGGRFVAFVRASTVLDDDNVPVGFVGISVNATERVEAEEDLRQARDYLAVLTDSMGEGLIAVDQSGGVLFMNAFAEERLGWTCEELVGSNLHEKAHYRRPDGSAYPIEECPLMGAREGKTVRVDEDTFYRRDGSPFPISCTSSPFELADGGTGVVIVFADITERKRAEWELRASQKQLQAIVDNTSAAIYVKRKGDYRYLMGNPEFERVVGLEPGTAAGARDEDFIPVAALQSLRETDRQVVEEGAEVSLEEEILAADGPRTFLTMKFPLPDEQGEPYALCGISTDITERKRREAELSERFEWEERIRTAVNQDLLLVYAQPIIDLRSGVVVQEELLIRMQGPGGPDDVIPPGAFLPQAERFGLIGEIDRWMAWRGIQLAAQGRAVEINLSGCSIGDRALTRQIERDLASSGADPSLIVFEITETAAVEDLEAAREFSDRVARLGCRCALDDFGTGYGSLTYQRNLAVHFLKIDMSFVRGMADNKADRQVVQTIVQMAKDYGQQTIAEGVEDEATRRLLQEYGVDYAQGYQIGRPSPVSPASAPGLGRRVPPVRRELV